MGSETRQLARWVSEGDELMEQISFVEVLEHAASLGHGVKIEPSAVSVLAKTLRRVEADLGRSITLDTDAIADLPDDPEASD